MAHTAKTRRAEVFVYPPLQQSTEGEAMNRILILSASLILFGSAAQAQTTGSLNGQWSGTTKSPTTGNELTIQVKIAETGGTWRYGTPASASKAGPCLGREFPLAINALPNAKHVFTIDGASVIAGCPSFALTLERTNESTLVGAFGDGRPAVLRKQ